MKRILMNAGLLLIIVSAAYLLYDRLNTDNTEAAEKQKQKIQTFKKERLIGKIKSSHDSLVKIDSRYTDRNIYMNRKAHEAFDRMYKAALKDNVQLKIISAFRSFYDQKYIWEAKWNGHRRVSGMNLKKDVKDEVERAELILRYSSMPGTSRHHWGTDIDLNSLTNSWFDSGEGKKIYDWLTANASSYGFCQVYTDKSINNRTGYEEEKWHWSYVPVAEPMTQAYLRQINYRSLAGFDGDTAAEKIDVIKNYVAGISPACRRSE